MVRTITTMFSGLGAADAVLEFEWSEFDFVEGVIPGLHWVGRQKFECMTA